MGNKVKGCGSKIPKDLIHDHNILYSLMGFYMTFQHKVMINCEWKGLKKKKNSEKFDVFSISMLIL